MRHIQSLLCRSLRLGLAQHEALAVLTRRHSLGTTATRWDRPAQAAAAYSVEHPMGSSRCPPVIW